MRGSRQSTSGSQNNLSPTGGGPNVLDSDRIPFAQRLTCTIADACEVTGLGRTKIYEPLDPGDAIALLYPIQP
jgi:hypothetical protein